MTFPIEIDWPLLRSQKDELLKIEFAKVGDAIVVTGDLKESVTGVIHLIDALQDHAVDDEDTSESEVFGESLDDNEDYY